MTRPHRFHYEGTIGEDPAGEVLLCAEESHHALRVLRLGPGAALHLIDGGGRLWRGEIGAVTDGRVRVAGLAPLPSPAAPALELHLAVALLKRRAMDWMIEKLSELGAASLQPLITERTEAQARTPPERWERIARAAAKQSGRGGSMRFHPPVALDAWLAAHDASLACCFADASPSSPSLIEWLHRPGRPGARVLAAIGPEGGWTPPEIERFEAAGFAPVGLGPLTLRAETAAIAVASVCAAFPPADSP